MGEKSLRVVDNLPDDTCIDVPHDPEAEAALLQETRERLSMLESHTANPEVVAALQELSEDLYSIIGTLSVVEEYECDKEFHNLEE